MKTQFELVESEQGNYVQMTDAQGVVWSVPIDESNSDYQRYLRWLENPDAEEGGTL